MFAKTETVPIKLVTKTPSLVKGLTRFSSYTGCVYGLFLELLSATPVESTVGVSHNLFDRNLAAGLPRILGEDKVVLKS